jgi:hypothetical protein
MAPAKLNANKTKTTLKKKLQSFPWQRDLKAFTVVFHEEITDNERSCDESFER